MRSRETYAPIQQVRDAQPIRAVCFHPTGEAYVVGTNSKSLKICKYPDEIERKRLLCLDTTSDNNYTDNHARRQHDNNNHDEDDGPARNGSRANNTYTSNGSDAGNNICHTINYHDTTTDCNAHEHPSLDNSHILSEPEFLFTCLHIHCGSVYCCAFNQAGDLLATGSNDQTVHVIKYNPVKHAPEGSEYKLAIQSGTVRDVCFMQGLNGSLLVSAGAGENEINVTDCNTMKLTQVLRGHESAVMSLNCFANSSNTFVSGSLDGTIRLWDLRSRRPVLSLATQSSQSDHKTLTRSELQTSPSKDFLPPESDCVLGDAGGETSNAGAEANGHNREHHQEHKENHQPPTPTPTDNAKGTPVGVVRVESSGRLLASGHKDGTCMLHDIRANRIIQKFQAHADEIRALNFSPNSYYLLTAGYDGKVRLADIQGHLTHKLPSAELLELDDKVVQAAWHPVDYNFATTCANGTATLWTIPDFDTWIDSIEMD